MILVYLQGCKAINLPSNSGTFHDPPQRKPILSSSHSPFLWSLKPLESTHLFSVSIDLPGRINGFILLKAAFQLGLSLSIMLSEFVGSPASITTSSFHDRIIFPNTSLPHLVHSVLSRGTSGVFLLSIINSIHIL